MPPNRKKNQPIIKIPRKWKKIVIGVLLIILLIGLYFTPLGTEYPQIWIAKNICDEGKCGVDNKLCIINCVIFHMHLWTGVLILGSLLALWLITRKTPKIRV